jgi:AcrR family transcriptional regulator
MVRKSNGRLQRSGFATAGAAIATTPSAVRARSPRARRRDRQRDAILRAAARLFRERGFADTGMRDIAAAADLSAANLYHYFNGKHDLLFYCQDRALDRMLAAVASARKASRSAPERLRLVFTAHLQTLLDAIEGATAHLQIDSLPPPMREAIVRKRDRYERALRRIVVEGIAGGELVDVDPAIVARAALGSMNWTVTWFSPEGPDSAATVGDVISRFLVRGVAARTPAARRAFPAVKR